jgi:cytochrome c-type biogenesis protein CcmE
MQKKEICMNTKTKRRLVVVSGVIIIVLVVILALVGSNSSAKTVSIDEALNTSIGTDQKIQVSGTVVDNSFEIKGNTLTFALYDPDGESTLQLSVVFEGGISATFGNGVTAIVTGKLSDDKVLVATEMLTKCPSKYESATDALSVSRLLDYQESILDKPVKVVGVVGSDTLNPAGTDERFVLIDSEGNAAVSVEYDGALSEEIQSGSTLIVTGSLAENGKFVATDVSLEG